jgi:hypothetical protein
MEQRSGADDQMPDNIPAYSGALCFRLLGSVRAEGPTTSLGARLSRRQCRRAYSPHAGENPDTLGVAQGWYVVGPLALRAATLFKLRNVKFLIENGIN